MATEGRTTLKTYFETGDIPTQDQFINLIDSCVNNVDDFTLIKSTVKITPAQMLDLANTYPELVAAPGADKYLLVTSVYFFMDYQNDDYTLGGELRIKTDRGSIFALNGAIPLESGDTIAPFFTESDAFAITSPNTNIRLEAANDFASGDSDIYITVVYQVLDDPSL